LCGMKFSQTKRLGTVFNRSACVEGPQKVQWPYNRTAAKRQFDLFDVPFRRSHSFSKPETDRVPKSYPVAPPVDSAPPTSPDKRSFLGRANTAPAGDKVWQSLPGQQPKQQPRQQVWRICENCRHEWLSNERKGACPQCTTDKPWKWLPKQQVWKSCHTCAYSWKDKYGKNECPKCLLSLDPDSLSSLSPQVRLKPSDALQSTSGKCAVATKSLGYPMPHVWKYGKCNFCSLAQGAYVQKDVPPVPYPGSKRSMCYDGNKHTFKFTVCTKCGERDFDVPKTVPEEPGDSRQDKFREVAVAALSQSRSFSRKLPLPRTPSFTSSQRKLPVLRSVSLPAIQM